MNIFNVNKDEDFILEENKQLKRKRKVTLKELETLRREKEELSCKYIELLEEKTKGFDQYLYYHDQYKESYNKVKEQKKEIFELKIENKRLLEELENKKNPKKEKNKNEKNVNEE